MNPTPVVHPNEEILVSFGLGKTDEKTTVAIAEHLEQCSVCRSRVADLSSDSFIDRLTAVKISSGSSISENALSTVRSGERGPSSPLPLPSELANCAQYEAIRELGKGGMGTVYVARNKLLGREEVLKVVNKSLLDRPEAIDRFLREIQSAARLQHPNVVTAYSAMRLGELLVFAMEYVPGQDLAQVARSANRPVPVPNACYYVLQAALGLQHAHEKGMVHRDIKPSNLILSQVGTKPLIKILDFGLAKLNSENKIDTSLTGEGTMLGTPDFMAPEQAMDAAQADIRADIYSLGCTLFFLLTGRPPFAADSLMKLLQHHQSTAAPSVDRLRPDVPDELAAVVARMLAKEPRMRYQTPAEVVKALTPFLNRGTSKAPAQAPPGAKKSGTAALAQSQPVNSEKKSHPSATPSLFPSLPVDFGRYRLLKLLGQGGMGAVYLANDSQLGRQVALKIPFFSSSDSPQRVERFIREAKSAAILHHPNICTVFDTGAVENKPFITMAYIAGASLDQVLQSDKPMPERQAAEIVRKIALALAHAHGKGTVHRDLKPANIMIGADGEPVVMDFGLAKRASHQEANEGKLTRRGAVLGTPSYMSPEQVKGGTDTIGPATDIYSLGVILFQMLTNRTPYSGSMVEVMGQILAAPVPPVKELQTDVDPRLDAICRKAMAKDPKSRFQSMEEFASALEEILQAPTSSPQEETDVELVAPAAPPAVEGSPFGGLDEMPVKAAIEPEEHHQATPKKTHRRYYGGIVAGIGTIALLAFAASIIFKVKTQDGILVVEVNEPNAEVYIDGDLVKVSWDKGGKIAEIRVKSGTRKVEVKKDGFTVFGEEVMFEDGKRRILEARLDKPPSPGIPGKDKNTPAKTPDPPQIQASTALEALRRDQIPPEALALAGDGDPSKAPASLVGVLGKVIPIHYKPVLGLAYSPDGRWLASGSEDKTIVLRDVITGDVIRTLTGHTEAVFGLAFSKNSRTLLSAGFDDTLRLWSVDNVDKPIVVNAKFGPKQPLKMAASYDGRFVALGVESGLIKLWKWGDWEKPVEFPSLNDKLRMWALALSSDGALLACGGEREANDKEIHCLIRIHSTADGTLKGTLKHSIKAVHALSFSHDGKYLASVGGQGNGCVWEISSGKEVAVLSRDYLRGEWPNSHSVAWSPDDKTIAVGGHLQVAIHDSLTGNRRTMRWDFTRLDTHSQLGVRAMAFNAQGNCLAAGGFYGDVPVWDCVTWKSKYLEFGHRHFVRSLSFSPKGPELLTLGDEAALMRWSLGQSQKPVVRHLEIDKMPPLTPLNAEISCSRDGRIETTTWLTGFSVRDTVTGNETFTRTGDGPLGYPHVSAYAASPDGRTLAGGRAGRLTLWDLSTGRDVHRFPTESNLWPALAFSRDGGLLAAYNEKTKLMMIWNAVTGNEFSSCGVNSLTVVSAFNPDGKVLATGQADGLIILWDTASGKKLQTLAGHTAQMRNLKFSPDGKTLVSSGDDGTIRLWNPEQPRAREIIPIGPAKRFLTFDLDPSGKYLFAAGSMPVIFILRLP